MADKILTLLDSEKSKGASKVLSSVKFEKVVRKLCETIYENNEKSIILLTNIFHGLIDDQEGNRKKEKLVLQVFRILNKEQISAKVSNDIIGFLLLEVEHFQVKELHGIAQFILKSINDDAVTNSKSLELFPKILTILSSCSNIPVEEEGEMDGDEYKRMIINKLSNMKWSPKMTLFICTMTRDMLLSSEEMVSLVQKIISMFSEISLEEIPPLVYQLLLLSNKGSQKEVIDGIITFFFQKSLNLPEEDANPLLQEGEDEVQQLRSAEGTVLLHVTFAVKQNQELGRVFLKYIKAESQMSSRKVLSTFAVGLILALTQIHRLEEQLLDFLRSYILKIFKDDVRRNQSKTIKDLFPDTLLVEDSIMSAVRNSDCGWDYVSDGLTELGFVLINCYTAKNSDYFTLSSEPLNPAQRACKLGLNVIHNIFIKQEILREPILQKLLNIIIVKASQNVRHYLDLLSKCVAAVPQIVIDCLSKFHEAFEYLSLLNLATTEGLLRAVLPLMKVSMTIKDSLILVLKKSMFSKQLEARKIAVTGFLLILKHFKIITDGAPYSLSSQIAFSQSFSCSQLDISTQGRYNVAANEAFCIEIIGNLRKSLKQHGDVRESLYNGIYEVVQKNPRLSHAVLDLLYQQFIIFYEKDDEVLPPIKIKLCSSNHLGEMQLCDPLADLLYALQLCTKKSGKRLDSDDEEDENLSHLLDDVEEALSSLTRRMIKVDLEDFELDKTAEYNTNTEEGVKNQISAQILLGIYEVLIEYNFMKAANISTDLCETLEGLFLKHQKIVEVLKEKGNTNGKKGKSSNRLVKHHFSFKCLSTMMSTVLCNEDVAAEPGLNILRQSVDFSKFIANATLVKLNQVIDTKQCSGSGGKNLDHIFRHSVTLAKSLLRHINGDCLLPDEVLKKDKGRRLGNICLDSLNAIMSFVCKHMSKDQLNALLKSLDFSPDVITQNDAVTDGSLVFRITRRIQRMAVKIISSPDEELGHKEAMVLIQMIIHLIPHIDNQTEIIQVYSWFYRIANEHAIDDLALTKVLLSQLLTLHHKYKGSNSAITKLSQDIHSQMGDIDEDIEVENRSHFQIVTEKTSSTIFIIILHNIESIIDEVDWVLSELRNITVNFAEDENENERDLPSNNREKIIVSVSQTLIGIVLSLHELTQSAFALGVVSDTLTKIVTKLYTLLGNFTKYHLTMYSQRNGQVLPKFERLVKLTGSHLVQQVYAMLPYMQATQIHQAQEQTLNGRAKSKDKKKANLSEKNRALKESRSIPNLIYSIEQFERYLIQLSKKSKIDMMENMKRSTSRDFRINAASLEAALQDLSGDENNEGENNAVETEGTNVSNSTADENPPEAKRLKTHNNTSRKPLKSVSNK